MLSVHRQTSSPSLLALPRKLQLHEQTQGGKKREFRLGQDANATPVTASCRKDAYFIFPFFYTLDFDYHHLGILRRRQPVGMDGLCSWARLRARPTPLLHCTAVSPFDEALKAEITSSKRPFGSPSHNGHSPCIHRLLLDDTASARVAVAVGRSHSV